MRQRIALSVLVDFAAGRLSPEEALHVLDELERDKEASAIVDTTIDLLEASNEDGKWLFGPQIAERSSRLWPVLAVQRWKQKAKTMRWRFAGAVASLALCLAAFIVFRNPPSQLMAREASVTEGDLHFLVRGGTITEIEWASHLLNTGHPSEAIDLLEWYIRAFHNSSSLSVAHFLAGIAWMMNSQHEVGGIYLSIDEESVRRAIVHFELVEADSTANSLVSDARWYKARAYLMIGDIASATAALRKLIAAEGPHAQDAKNILERLPFSPSR